MKQEPNHNPLSREFLLQRSFCCGKNCVNCPFIPKWQRGTDKKN